MAGVLYFAAVIVVALGVAGAMALLQGVVMGEPASPLYVQTVLAVASMFLGIVLALVLAGIAALLSEAAAIRRDLKRRPAKPKEPVRPLTPEPEPEPIPLQKKKPADSGPKLFGRR